MNTQMEFLCACVIGILAFTSDVTKAQSISVTPSFNFSGLVTSNVTFINATYTNTSTPPLNTFVTHTSTQSVSVSKNIFSSTPSSSMPLNPSSSVSPSSNSTVKGQDMKGDITMYLLISCVALFVIIIIILIVLVIQMKRLTNKLNR